MNTKLTLSKSDIETLKLKGMLPTSNTQTVTGARNAERVYPRSYVATWDGFRFEPSEGTKKMMHDWQRAEPNHSDLSTPNSESQLD